MNDAKENSLDQELQRMNSVVDNDYRNRKARELKNSNPKERDKRKKKLKQQKASRKGNWSC